MALNFKTTKDIDVSEKIIDQVIGQEEAVAVIKKASKQRRHVLLIGEPGTGKCVGGETEIVTTEGPIKARDLYTRLMKTGVTLQKNDEEYLIVQESKFAFTLNKAGKVTKNKIIKAYRGKRKKAIKITTASGTEFTVSGDHPVSTIKNNEVVFLPADELKNGAFIGSARKLPESENKTLPIENIVSRNIVLNEDRFQFIGKNGVKSLNLKLPRNNTNELSYFVGICLAEARWQGNLNIYNQNIKIKKKIVEVLRNVFDYPKEFIEVRENHIILKKSRTLAHFMSRIFDFPLETAKQSSKKKIPKVFFDSNNDLIGAFLSGLIDGDGHIGKRGFEITLSSQALINNLKLLLLKMGIQSRIGKSIKCATNTKQKTKRAYYRLSIYDSRNLEKLRKNINLIVDYKKNNLSAFKNKSQNTNVDIIPAIGKTILELKNKIGVTYDDLGYYCATFSKFGKGKRNVSRVLAQQIISQFKLHRESANSNLILQTEIDSEIRKIEQLADSDIFWDKIKTMTLVEEDIYDFEVKDTHNFVVSSGVIVHNSMLGIALAELLPKEKLKDVLGYPNPNDENQPLIRTVSAGKGREIVARSKMQGSQLFKHQNIFVLALAIIAMVAPWWILEQYKESLGATAGAIMFAAFFVGGLVFVAAFILFLNLGKRMDGNKTMAPKLVVDNFGKEHAPFLDATGAHAGALLGDVLHDPFQSGGLGTPAHERVVAGMIHKAHMGVLFVDEIATLAPHTQQELLTALQDGKYSITGQSERSAGAMVRTEPVPCNFILVSAGNIDTIKNMHPALRSRIRGYGYEVYMKETIEDTPKTRERIAIFVAQEVKKDKKIPHFSKAAVMYMIEEARRRANRKGHLTLRFRELGGIIRAAGDVAVEEKAKVVEKKHILKAKKSAQTLEEQMADKFIERKKEYEVIVVKGNQVGRVNGLAVMGSGSSFSGIVLPIESEVTPGGDQKQIVATGKLGEIAKEAIKNVSAIIKKFFGDDIKKHHDIYVQFLQTYEGVEGDSASIAVATAIISALKKIPIRQDCAMTGSLSVRGKVLPIGGVSSKVEAAIEAGIKKIIVPKSNMKDIVVDDDKLKKIKIVAVENIVEVLEHAMDWKKDKKVLNMIKKSSRK